MNAQALPGGDLRLFLTLPENASLLADGSVAWLVRDDSIFEPIAPELPAAYAAIFKGDVVIPASAVAGFLAREAPLLALHFDFVPPTAGAGETIPSAAFNVAGPVPVTFHLKIEGSLNYLGAKLEAESVEWKNRVDGAWQPAAESARSRSSRTPRGGGFFRPQHTE